MSIRFWICDFGFCGGSCRYTKEKSQFRNKSEPDSFPFYILPFTFQTFSPVHSVLVRVFSNELFLV